jgi:hypothetical protein
MKGGDVEYLVKNPTLQRFHFPKSAEVVIVSYRHLFLAQSTK